MTKFVKTSPNAAYSVAVGVTAQEAADLGLAVVETDGSGAATAWGKYDDAPDGGPLGITIDRPGETKVIAGGGAGNPPAAALGGKGSIVNVNDPFIHGGTGDESIHADNAAPLTVDLAAEEREAADLARQSIEDATKTRKGK